MFQVVDTAAGASAEERRADARIAIPFLVSAGGTDVDGVPFQVELRAENLSARGLYCRLPRHVAVGAEITVVIRFVLSPNSPQPAAQVVGQGRVCRVEPQPDGNRGVAIEFSQHKFLYPSTAPA